MYKNYDQDTHYTPLGSVVVFSQNTAHTSNGEMVYPQAGYPPQESTMVQEQIATTDTPENPGQTKRKNDHELLRTFALLILMIGVMTGIGFGIYAVGRFIYCLGAYCGE